MSHDIDRTHRMQHGIMLCEESLTLVKVHVYDMKNFLVCAINGLTPENKTKKCLFSSSKHVNFTLKLDRFTGEVARNF